MGRLLFFKMTADERWAIVKDFYETNYKIRFKSRPDNAQIEDLYRRMKLVEESVAKFYDVEPVLKRNYFHPKQIQKEP